MEKITVTLYLDNYDDSISFEKLVESSFSKKPQQILVKGESRILNNGKKQLFPNKKNQVTFEMITDHSPINDLNEIICSYFENHAEELTAFKRKINFTGHIYINIKTDHKYLRELFFDIKTINLLNQFEIEIVVSFLLD